MSLRTFFRQYDLMEMHPLNKFYFGSSPKFAPLKSYTANGGDFLDTYQDQRKGHKFGVFVPVDLDANGDAKADLGAKAFNTTLERIKSNSQKLKGLDFLLMPLVEHTRHHWTVLKIQLNENGEIAWVEHFDPSLMGIIRPGIRDLINTKLGNKPKINIEFKNPLLIQQIDPVNCGPFSHHIIKDLAKKRRPSFFTKTGMSERAKDFTMLQKAREANLHGFPKNYHEVPFLIKLIVKHRKLITTIAITAALAVTIGLFIAFPPAGIAAGIATAAAAIGVGIPVFGVIAAGLTAGLSMLTGLAVSGIAWFKNRNKPEKVLGQYRDFPLTEEIDPAPANPPAAVQPVPSDVAPKSPVSGHTSSISYEDARKKRRSELATSRDEDDFVDISSSPKKSP